MTNLDGVTMYVSSTAANGVVSGDTRLQFRQRGSRVWARYAGGKVSRAWLVGRWNADTLRFRYTQVEDGHVHAGTSTCDVQRLSNGGIRLVEHFAWRTREGSGVNVFDEL